MGITVLETIRDKRTERRYPWIGIYTNAGGLVHVVRFTSYNTGIQLNSPDLKSSSDWSEIAYKPFNGSIQFKTDEYGQLTKE